MKNVYNLNFKLKSCPYSNKPRNPKNCGYFYLRKFDTKMSLRYSLKYGENSKSTNQNVRNNRIIVIGKFKFVYISLEIP